MGRAYDGDLRAALIEEANAQLESTPRDLLSLRKIAKSVGVSHVAVYRYFEGLSDILVEVAIPDFQGMEKYIRERIANMPIREAVAEAGIAYVQYAQSKPNRFRNMFAALRQPTPELAVAASGSFFILVELLTTWKSEGGLSNAKDVDSAALTMWATAHGMAMLALDDALPPGAGSPEDIAQGIVALLD